MSDRPDLSIVVVSYNTRDLLRACLHSVAPPVGAPGPSVELFVVDNASRDGSADLVRAEFPGVHLIANRENVGFPRGCNQALRRARGRYAMLLNPDSVVLDDALARIVAYLDAHPDVGALGPQLVNPDGSVQSSRRRFPTLLTGFIESTVLQRYLPDHPALRHYYALDLPDDRPSEVDWVTGACLVVRRAAIERVGLLDEGFFMYSEELDWCRRIKQAGWKVVYFPAARVVHYGGKSSEQDLLGQHLRFHDSKVRYFRKHHGFWPALALRLFIFATYWFQLAEEGGKWLLGHKRPLRAERLRLILGVLRHQAARLIP